MHVCAQSFCTYLIIKPKALIAFYTCMKAKPAINQNEILIMRTHIQTALTLIKTEVKHKHGWTSHKLKYHVPTISSDFNLDLTYFLSNTVKSNMN